jgi:prohibitin 2
MQKSSVSKVDALRRAVSDFDPPSFRRFGSRWLWALFGLVFLYLLGHSFVLVGAGERAVIFNRFTGTQPYQLGEGLHLLLPWVQYPTVYDVKTRTYTMSAASSESNPQAGNANDALTALTADGLPVTLDLSILFHVDPNNVWRLHREIGPLYVEKVVRPQARSHVRMVVSQYPVVDVYGGRRARIVAEINARLKELFARNYIVLDEALLRHVSFSNEFQQAIEQKQVAQQEVQQMQFVLQQAEKERRRKIIEAEGEAESIRLKAAALAQNPKLVEYEYVMRLPANIRTVVTDGRTIVNLGDALNGAAAGAAADDDERSRRRR